MLVDRFAFRFLVVAFVVCSFFTLLLVSRPASIATEAPESPPISGDAQQAALPNERRSSNAMVSTASPVSSAASLEADDETDCDNLPKDHRLRLQLNGKRLPLDYVGLEKGSEKSLLKAAKVLPLSDGRWLAGLGDTLYMLNQSKHIEWKYKPSWILWDFAVVESMGLVYGGAGDGIMFILDSSTGKRLYGHFQNGKADHLQVEPFGEDICLITNSMAGYRDALDEWTLGKLNMIETDGITAWRGTEALWSMDFPPDADLVVHGDKIYAVTKTDKSIYVREIIPPKTGAR